MNAKLLFVVTEDWYFVSHRLQLAVAAREAGFDVAVATRVNQHAATIRAAGIRLIPFELSRRSGNPLREIWALLRLYRQEKPDIVHHVALKPVLFGSLAARIVRGPICVNAVAGLGWLFTSGNGLLGAIRPLLHWTLARILDHERSLTITQNPDDAQLLRRSGVNSTRLRLIRGAGVNLADFAPAHTRPAGIPVVMLASRMLWSKGVEEFIAAAHTLNATNIKARFVLVGEPDPANPGAVPVTRLNKWHGTHGIEWWGHSNTMSETYAQAHIACLPSFYGEGIPKTLLEAAACGLPIITTDTPGCREVVQQGVNGLLIPPRNAQALTEALAQLIIDPALCHRFGQQGRIRAKREFSESIINTQTLAVYQEALSLCHTRTTTCI